MLYRTNNALLEETLKNLKSTVDAAGNKVNLPEAHRTPKTLARLAAVSYTTLLSSDDRGCSEDTIKKLANVLKIVPYSNLIRDEDRLFLDATEPEGQHKILFCMRHRNDPKAQWYYERAFSSGLHVIYLSIMSHDSFELVRKNYSKETKLDVLTWNPLTEAEIFGFAKHEISNFDPESAQAQKKIKQVQTALEGWDDFAHENPNVTVHTYESAPTMQGIVVLDGWAMIELLPYATRTQMRPCMILRRGEPHEREPFELLSASFKELCKSARQRQPGESSPWFQTPHFSGTR